MAAHIIVLYQIVWSDSTVGDTEDVFTQQL